MLIIYTSDNSVPDSTNSDLENSEFDFLISDTYFLFTEILYMSFYC
jgi:hypothetical protein